MEQTAQDASNLNPLAVALLVVISLVVLYANRQNAVGAFLVAAAFIPLGQQLVVFGLHFHFLRLLLLVGFCRVLVHQELEGFTMNLVDKLFVYWALTGIVCGIFRGPSPETFGSAFNALGTYFLIRVLTNSPEDMVDHLRVLALVVLVIGACMSWEASTGKNPFHVFGGVPEIPADRGERFRCQGPFRNYILAGTFGATLFPLMAGLWFQGGSGRRRAVLGTLGCVMVTVLSTSSGPILCFLAALAGLALWPMRDRMRFFRRSVVVMILGLAVVMKAPVWYLIAKVSDVVGGGGWHRSYVIDQFVKHFSEWWLVGTSYTAHWAPAGEVIAGDPNNMDITNNYVVQGISGGLLMLGLFLAMIVCCFKIVGRAVRTDVKGSLDPKLLWTVGVALAAHCTAFFSIPYFDQTAVFWYWLLAVISGIQQCENAVASEDWQVEWGLDAAEEQHAGAEPPH
ncbi:MAG: hypothetical protein ABSD58_09795 [Verrucomicrobiia bacterium]|jgi:hypothetical protein